MRSPDYMNEMCGQMGQYLYDHVCEGETRNKLHDQLVWLQYQINHYNHKPSEIEILEENFMWVLSNFQHDLRLGEPFEKEKPKGYSFPKD